MREGGRGEREGGREGGVREGGVREGGREGGREVWSRGATQCHTLTISSPLLFFLSSMADTCLLRSTFSMY